MTVETGSKTARFLCLLLALFLPDFSRILSLKMYLSDSTKMKGVHMASADEKRVATAMSGGMAATIFGAALTIGAVVLSNKEIRNKLLRMVSNGIDKLTESSEGMKKSIHDTADRVEKGTRKTMEHVKETVDGLVDEGRKGAKRVSAAK